MEKLKKPLLKYYTDGACSGNPGPGGFGVIRLSTIFKQNELPEAHLAYCYSERFENTTNNRMELMAVMHVLKKAQENKNYFYIIYSDSAYVVQLCSTWIWEWAKNGWTRAKGKPIKNLDLIKELYNLLNNSTNYSIKKCAGHVGFLENELADAVAANNQEKFNKLIKKYNIIT